MGGGQSNEPEGAPVVDHAGFSDEEVATLRKRLGVPEDVAEARVELPAFLERFEPHVRPLIQPLFFRLAREAIGEPSAAWPVLVSGLSRLVRRGISWGTLLKIWSPASAGESTATFGSAPSADGRAAAAAADAKLHIELAATLCFWCAFPELTPARLAGADRGESSGSVAFVEQFAAALQTAAEGGVDLDTAAKQLTEWVPELPTCVGPLFGCALLGAAPLPQPAAVASRILNPALLLLVRSMQASLWDSDPWIPLFRDWADGRSFNAILKGSLHYGGPALLLIRTVEGQVIGALSNSWEEGNGRFGGGPECFLFSLFPQLGVFRSQGASGNHVYLNSRNKHHARGLGFGGQENFNRLWLDADFENCSVLESDATYGPGTLLPPNGFQTKFQPGVVEIWGCGGEEAAEAQGTQRARDEGFRDAARKVDRAKMMDNEFDKEMFFGKTFAATADVREVVEMPTAEGEEEPKHPCQ